MDEMGYEYYSVWFLVCPKPPSWAGVTTPEDGKLTGFFDEGTFKERLDS